MNCTICSRKKVTSEATQFCAECGKYFCDRCLGAHDIVHDDHVLKAAGDVTSGKTEVLPTEKCDQHPAEVIKMFCRSHDLAICNTCAFMHHRKCDDVVYIPEVISSLMPQTDIETSRQQLTSCIEKLAEIGTSHKSAEDHMQQEKHSCLDQIEELADKLIAKIQAMKQAAVDNVADKFQKLEDENEAKGCGLQDVKEELLSCLQQLENSDGNLPQAFVMMKKSQKLMSKVQKLQDVSVEMKQNHAINFLTETAIEQYLDGFQSLASFKKPQKKQVRREPDLPVKDSWDHETCNITGACVLPEGAILLADAGNKKLKRVNTATNTIIDTCTLGDRPFAVCAVGQHEAAVTLNNNKFQFVSVSKKMHLLKSYSVQHNCFGITFHGTELFVTDGGNSIYVYNKIGQELRVLSSKSAGWPMFTQARHITIGPQGERVYITCMDRGMTCVDRKGKELYKNQGSLIKKGFGVCVDGTGSIFVSSVDSNNVVQLREGGEEVGEVLTQENGITAAQAIVLDQTRNRLFVSQHNNNVVCVFSIV